MIAWHKESETLPPMPEKEYGESDFVLAFWSDGLIGVACLSRGEGSDFWWETQEGLETKAPTHWARINFPSSN